MQMPKGAEERENVSILNTFDFAAIEEMDPSLGMTFWLTLNKLMDTRSFMTEKFHSSLESKMPIPDPKKSAHSKLLRLKLWFSY